MATSTKTSCTLAVCSHARPVCCLAVFLCGIIGRHAHSHPDPSLAGPAVSTSNKQDSTLCRLTDSAEELTAVLQAVIFGNASQSLPVGFLSDAYARSILLDPVCLRKLAANCRSTTDPYYTVSWHRPVMLRCCKVVADHLVLLTCLVLCRLLIKD